jgi:hypothetical protein
MLQRQPGCTNEYCKGTVSSAAALVVPHWFPSHPAPEDLVGTNEKYYY